MLHRSVISATLSYAPCLLNLETYSSTITAQSIRVSYNAHRGFSSHPHSYISISAVFNLNTDYHLLASHLVLRAVIWRNSYSRLPFLRVRIFSLSFLCSYTALDIKSMSDVVADVVSHSRTHWENGAISSLDPSGSLEAREMVVAPLLKHFPNCKLGISKISTSSTRRTFPTPHVLSIWRRERVAASSVSFTSVLASQ